MFIGDDTLAVRFAISMQCFDIVFLGGTLFVFRSRMWPTFFSIGLNELNNVKIIDDDKTFRIHGIK